MFRRLTPSAGMALTGSSTGSWITCNTSPFLRGGPAVLQCCASGSTGTPTIVIEGTEDGGTTVSTILTLTSADLLSPCLYSNIANLPKQIRFRQSAAGTAGFAALNLLRCP